MEPFRPIIDFWIAQSNMTDFTQDIKFGLVELLNLEIQYNGKNTIVRNAVAKHVLNCLKFLSGQIESVKIEVKLTHEVQNNALNSNV